MVEAIRLSAGTVVAIGLLFWAWRVRGVLLGGSALAYLAALWYLHEPVPPAPGVELLSEEQWTALIQSGTPLPAPGQPEFALAAGAVVAHAHAHHVRPWHVLAVVGFAGALWEPMAVVLCLAALVLAGYDLHARRPGAWYPLLLVGVGLWSVDAFDGWWLALDPPESGFTYSTAFESALAISYDHVDYDEVAFAVLVAAGLAVWAWRRRNAVVLLTAAAYLAGSWAVETRSAPWFPEIPTGSLVLAGAAVASATTARGPLVVYGDTRGTEDP
ncbi:hypothetical protein [Saccharothrix hoggarensis]|uniref:PAP2 superfamily protein n=1 Tax=Saccharothrix hoggarensis TaxID=913853 RepID=A0ABW3QY90_9PSEU